MKDSIVTFLSNISFKMLTDLWCVIPVIIIFAILIRMITNYKFILYDKSDFLHLQNMTEEEKKLHIITYINTKINREQLDKSYYYANEIHKEIYGSPYSHVEKKERTKKNKKVKFGEDIVFMCEY